MDRRIRDLERLVDSGRYDILSLDLFDTVIWRMVPAPVDVFFLVARRLAAAGALFDSASPESFVRERTGAEQRARLRRPSREVTLDEIYAEFPRGYLRGMEPAGVARIEFETEREVVRVHPDMAALIGRARERGLRIAFVSDTYFDEAQILALVGIEPDFLLLSSKERMSKFLGLHRRLFERSGVSPARVLHVGNDLKADVEGPAVFGMERYWFRQWPEGYEDLPALEFPNTLSDRAPLVGEHDAGLTTLRGAVAHRTDDACERWGALVAGPVLTGFAEWVAARCAAEGLRTVYCLMREGRMLRELLARVAPGLAAHEAFLSRYAARKAAIFEAGEEELRAFVFRPSPQKAGRILAQLGLPPDAGADPERVLSPEETVGLLRRIRGDAGLRRRVVEDSARARAGLLAHLRSLTGGAIPDRVAVVDLGYKGTIQECLQRILDRERLGVRSHGLYLVTGGDVHETQATGAPAEGWLAENAQPISMAHTFMRSPEVFEQSLMARCGTTRGHRDDGEPVLDAVTLPEAQLDQIEAVQRGMLRFADAWREHRDRLGVSAGEGFRRLARAICIRSVARPLPVELELFEAWRHDENFGTETTRALSAAEGLDPWEAAHISAHQLASLPMSRLHWPFSFARRISPTMGEAVTSIFLRSATPEAFDSAFPEQLMAVYWDTGRGFHQEEGMVRTYRLNNRGTAWQRFTLDFDASKARPRRLGFTIGLRNDVLRLTGVALSGDGGTDRLADRLPHDAIEKHGYEHLGGNLYRVADDPALLVVPLEAVPEGVRKVDVDVFFGLIPEAA